LKCAQNINGNTVMLVVSTQGTLQQQAPVGAALHGTCVIVFVGSTWKQLMRRVLRNPTAFSKGKSVPLQARSGPEGCRKLRFPDYKTTAQDGGKVVSLKHRPLLPPENAP